MYVSSDICSVISGQHLNGGSCFELVGECARMCSSSSYVVSFFLYYRRCFAVL